MEGQPAAKPVCPPISLPQYVVMGSNIRLVNICLLYDYLRFAEHTSTIVRRRNLVHLFFANEQRFWYSNIRVRINLDEYVRLGQTIRLLKFRGLEYGCICRDTFTHDNICRFISLLYFCYPMRGTYDNDCTQSVQQVYLNATPTLPCHLIR